MKKIFVICSILIAVYSSTNSQTFTFTTSSPPFVNSDDTSYFAEIVDSLYINNLTSSSFEVRLIRTQNNLSQGWESALCDISQCYPPTVDTALGNYPPGASKVTLHFYPWGHLGQGCVTIRAEKKNNTSENYTLSFCAKLNPVGIKQISSIVKVFSLNQNYPNPFNPTTRIGFSVPATNYVDLRIYDILGREVIVLASQYMTEGEYEVEFDAKNLSSGMYYYRLQSGENVAVKKMTLVK